MFNGVTKVLRLCSDWAFLLRGPMLHAAFDLPQTFSPENKFLQRTIAPNVQNCLPQNGYTSSMPRLIYPETFLPRNACVACAPPPGCAPTAWKAACSTETAPAAFSRTDLVVTAHVLRTGHVIKQYPRCYGTHVLRTGHVINVTGLVTPLEPHFRFFEDKLLGIRVMYMCLHSALHPFWGQITTWYTFLQQWCNTKRIESDIQARGEDCPPHTR